eukprot:5831509-Ditylum_brightwellii.AAC.1
MQSQISARLTSNDTKQESGSIPTAQQELSAPVGSQSLDSSPSMDENETNVGLSCVQDGNTDGGGTTATEIDNTTVSAPSDLESSAELSE